MDQTKSSAILKQTAREQLLGNYGKIILAFFVIDLIPAAILFIAGDMLSGTQAWNVILYYIVYFLVILLIGVLALGMSKLFLNLTTGRPFRISDVFYGFHGHHDVGILIMLVNVGISVLCIIPFIVSAVIYSYTKSAFLYPVMALLLTGGAIVAYIQLLSLSQCFFIAVDFPDYGLKQVMHMSRRVMKGQRAKLFYLQVSFLPLALLCILSLGLGFLWLYPYIYCTLTHFYLDLMEYRTREAQR